MQVAQSPPGPEQSPGHSRRVWVRVSTASTPAKSSSPRSPPTGGAGSRRPTQSCWGRMRRRPRASRRQGRTACGSASWARWAPGSQARGGGSGRAAEPTTTPQPGWRERVALRVCFLPDFLSWRCTLCWEEMPPFSAHGPSQSCARHSEVPGHVPGLSALVNTCSGMFSPACPLLSFPHQPPVFSPLSGLSSALCSDTGSSGPALVLFPSRAPRATVTAPVARITSRGFTQHV